MPTTLEVRRRALIYLRAHPKVTPSTHTNHSLCLCHTVHGEYDGRVCVGGRQRREGNRGLLAATVNREWKTTQAVDRISAERVVCSNSGTLQASRRRKLTSR